MGKQKTAQELAKEHREISISEFFEKNKHLLGFDSKVKSLLIMIKEAVDNSLDACEESGILPDIYVKIEELEKDKYKILVKDNGPGIVKKQIPKIFGTLLYGSKFHKLRQSRGQQGLGISMCVLYSQLTTGESTEVISSTGNGKMHRYKLKLDVKTNTPEILAEDLQNAPDGFRGTQLKFIAEVKYREHQQSALEYIKQVAISNPFAKIIFDCPSGRYEFKRGVETLPPEPKEIKPHLYGVEIGILNRILAKTNARTLKSFLTTEFSRVGSKSAKEIIKKAEILTDEGKPNTRISPSRLSHDDVRNIIKAVKDVKLLKPPTDCLSPLGEKLIEEGLEKELGPEFVKAITRSPSVYRGWPFQIEVGLAYGGDIEEANIMRFANRVPLLYKSGDCAIKKSIASTDWGRYGVETDKVPEGPIAIFVHICSVWVPFTSESKEAVASYPAILKEIKLALQEAGRKLSRYLSGIRRAERQAKRKEIFERYAGETAVALRELTGEKKEEIEKQIKEIVSKKIKKITKDLEEKLKKRKGSAGKSKKSKGSEKEVRKKLKKSKEEDESEES